MSRPPVVAHDAAIRELRNQHWSVHRISEATHCSVASVRRRVHALGLPTDLRSHAGGLRERLVDGTQAGLSTAALARQEGVSGTTVRWHLEKAGLHRRQSAAPTGPQVRTWRCDCDGWQIQTGTTCRQCHQAPPWAEAAAGSLLEQAAPLRRLHAAV